LELGVVLGVALMTMMTGVMKRRRRRRDMTVMTDVLWRYETTTSVFLTSPSRFQGIASWGVLADAAARWMWKWKWKFGFVFLSPEPTGRGKQGGWMAEKRRKWKFDFRDSTLRQVRNQIPATRKSSSNLETLLFSCCCLKDGEERILFQIKLKKN
tara:strand:- start:61 stop:525 length:465 start_codon:yes stop_codon:yes gene_type:complete